MSQCPCDMKYIPTLPLSPPPPRSQHGGDKWWSSCSDAVYGDSAMELFYHLCANPSSDMSTEENSPLSHEEPISSSPHPPLLPGCSVTTLNFKFHPGTSWCRGIKQFPRAFCLPFLYMGNTPCCSYRGPQSHPSAANSLPHSVFTKSYQFYLQDLSWST